MGTVAPFSINTNVNGIPSLSSQGVSVSTTQVAYDFRQHTVVGGPFRGIITIRLAQPIPAGTTTTLPIVFTSEGGNSTALTTYDGEAVTVADIPGTGIYLVWFESSSNTLQLLTGVV